MVADKRDSQRKQFEVRCWVALGPSPKPLAEGLVSDVSHTGAKLALQETDLQLPDEFDLYLTPDGTVGRNCAVIWRDGQDVGVKFVGRTVPHRTSEADENPEVIVT